MNLQRERPLAGGIANGLENLTDFYEPQIITKACLCGQNLLPDQAFVIIESLIITITRVCAACSATLANGSFAERGKLALRLLARAERGAQ